MNTSKYNQIAEKLKPQKQVKKLCLSAFFYVLIIFFIVQVLLYFYITIFYIKEK